MSAERAAPCRHLGAPSEHAVRQVSQLITALGDNAAELGKHGLSRDEYLHALPMAIERLRGSAAASSADRRQFLALMFERMLDERLISKLEKPRYGDDTVYKLTVPGLGAVAIIQKGCPDGAHSSSAWTVPDWAQETYLWWLCPSLTNQPGDHIAKGVYRLRKKFLSASGGPLDGVIFHNELCGTGKRPCPKTGYAIEIQGLKVPPPCVYLMPRLDPDATEWNWDCSRVSKFAVPLLRLFGVDEGATSTFVGHIGFQRRPNWVRVAVTARYGPGKSTMFRS